MKNNELKKLLSVDVHALQDLHSVLYFDFNKPYFSMYIKGKFTVNQINKIAIENGFKLEESTIAICIKNNSKLWMRDFALVTLCGNTVNIEYRMPYHNKGRGLDYFYRKSDFEDARKNNESETFIFIQRNDNKTKPTKKQRDYTKRFKLINYDYCRTRDNKEYINRIYLMETDSNGTKFQYDNIGQIIYTGKNYEQNINNIIDKSGYFVKFKREELKRKAAGLRAEREKEKYRAVNNSVQIEELNKLIQKRKLEIIEELKQAETSLELRNVEKQIAYFRGFSGIVADFETFKEKTEKKQYASIEASNRIYNNIKERLTREETE